MCSGGKRELLRTFLWTIVSRDNYGSIITSRQSRASHWLRERAESQLRTEGSGTDGGIGEKERWRDGFLPSNRAKLQNNTALCPRLGGPAACHRGGRLMMLVWPAERRPTQTSAHYCQHTSRRKTLGAPRDTTLKRYTHTCPKVERLEEKKHESHANHIHLLDQSCDLVHTLSCVIMGHQQVKAECRCRCRRCE